MTDTALLLQRQITDSGAGIDQDFVIHQQTGGPQTRTDAAATAENLDPHAFLGLDAAGMLAQALAAPSRVGTRVVRGAAIGSKLPPMITSLAALLLYCAIAAQILRRPQSSPLERWLPLPALLLHGWVLSQLMFRGGAITIGINEALSLFTWQSALLLWALCFREPLRAMGTAIYPAAGLAAVLAASWPTPVSDIPITDWKARGHILLSLFSAGLLTLAAVHACLLAVQDRLLHSRRMTELSRTLPPLQTMERLLFQLIAIGFFLLSMTLLSGLWFIRDWLAQHLAHKTVLSVTAWLIFGVLLWGRLRHGWRGRTAIRWTLAGYATLILAYFGSKLILEQLLGRHWG